MHFIFPKFYLPQNTRTWAQFLVTFCIAQLHVPHFHLRPYQNDDGHPLRRHYTDWERELVCTSSSFRLPKGFLLNFWTTKSSSRMHKITQLLLPHSFRLWVCCQAEWHNKHSFIILGAGSLKSVCQHGRGFLMHFTPWFTDSRLISLCFHGKMQQPVIWALLTKVSVSFMRTPSSCSSYLPTT